MRRSLTATLAAGLVGSATLVLSTATPAAAAIGTGTTGTQVNVIITGNAGITFTCSGGNAAIVSAGVTTVPTPHLACSAMTKAVVAGDGGNQTVDGRGLDAAAFSAHPFLLATTAAGSDNVWDTAQADDITMGAGFDHLLLNPASVTNTKNDLGDDGGSELDTVEVLSLPTGGSATAATPANGDPVITDTNSSGTHTNTINDAEFVWFQGGNGNDTMNGAGITSGSKVSQLRFDGGPGNDALTTGPLGASIMFGNAGTNTFTTGSGFVNVISDSDTDVVHLGGPATVFDTFSLRSGGRSVTSSAGTQGWSLNLPRGDAAVHVRTGAGGGTVLTASLDRFGQQQLPPSVDDLGIGLYNSSAANPADHGLIDVQAQAGKTMSLDGTFSGGAPGNIADVLIPSGSWSTTGSVGTSSTFTITPSGGYGPITAKQVSAVSVHGPFASANESWAHRSVRDLLFRFLSDSDRALVTAQLDGHLKTRAQITAGLMDTDEYRALDVNRTFLDFLKRAADPGGKAYWVNSLSNGKSLRQFRAQLFGSSEYFTKAGGTNLGFLLSAYADVFGRTPDSGGQAYWLHRLDTGTERGIVARAFLASTEARRTIVKEQFLRFLVRFPTTDEANTWIPLLDRPTGEQDLIASLVDSSTYFAGP